ncbi:MAG: hypothetical protein ABIA63_07605, partial [bacterium]
ITFGISAGGKPLVFEMGREKSRLYILAGENGEVINKNIDLCYGPSIPGNPYLSEKPRAHFKAFVVNNYIILAYANARTKDKTIISGAMLFNFDGEKLDEISFNRPERFWTDKESNFYVQEAGGIKKWKIEKSK